MKLWQTRRHWEKFAHTDPMWAVLNDPGKKGNRWTIDEFFATGQGEIDQIMTTVRSRYPSLQLGRALDFGCGVGRLSQGLAAHFHRVTGVDIATQMLALARRHNRHPDRVEFVHNARPNLGGFESGSFDFVCSLITLQHIAPEYSQRYIAEFVRVLAPGGVAYFQVPTVVVRVPPERWQQSDRPTTLARRLQRFGYRLINRSVAIEPIMEMHGVPRETIGAIVAKAGGEVLDSFDSHSASPAIESYAYLVRKVA